MSDAERIAALEARVNGLERLFRRHGHCGSGLSRGLVVDRPMFINRDGEYKPLPVDEDVST